MNTLPRPPPVRTAADRYRVRELREAFLRLQQPADPELTPNEGHVRFARYLGRFVAPGSRVLDLGCGRGNVVRLLATAGYAVIGLDVQVSSTAHFHRVARDGESFCVGSGLALPFADGRFDAVTLFDVLEHVYEVEEVLAEALRVIAPGGALVIVSSNLLSPVHSVSALLSCLRHTDGFRLLGRRDPPPSPFGDHVPQIAWILLRNAFLLLRKLVASRVRPSYRVPDPDFVGWGGDTDAIYLCNPPEVRSLVERLGLGVVAYQGEGLTGRLGPLASGVWLAARKAAR